MEKNIAVELIAKVLNDNEEPYGEINALCCDDDYKFVAEKVYDNLVNDLSKQIVSGIIAEIDSLKKFNVEWVNNDGTKVIEHDKDGNYVDANKLGDILVNYR